MSQEEKKQTAPETEAAAEKPETPAQEAPEKEAPQTEEKNEGKHDCKHHHHETAALQAKLEAEEKKNADLKNQLLRTAAEYDNYRKRSQREADQKFNDGVSHAVTQILENLHDAAALLPFGGGDLLDGVHEVGVKRLVQRLDLGDVQRFQSLGGLVQRHRDKIIRHAMVVVAE